MFRFNLNLFAFVLAFTQLLAIVAAPIDAGQINVYQTSEECFANQRILMDDLNNAAETMMRVYLRFDKPAVVNVMDNIGGAIKQLDSISRVARFGGKVDPQVTEDLVTLARNARAHLDEVNGVPDVKTAHEVTSAVWTMQDALSMAQAVAYAC
ncbi:unnamed protein product [Peniophora sp. CBMAI 1063]|nr:unnamed protein product [Peniophora sp. CBMAI 1063]